jgi:hypothetical protein
MSNLPALRDALKDAPVFHQILGEILDELGGMPFLVDWAEQNPTIFVQMLAAAAMPPARVTTHNTQFNLQMPEGISTSLLDQHDV